MATIAESAGTIKFDTTWTAAVQRVSELAHAKFPESLHGRLERACGLVLTGGVWVEESGQTFVRASDGARWYHVNGTCGCQDAQHQAQDGLCKHRLAKAIYRRAGELVRDGLPPVSADLDALPASTPAPLPEAPASVNCYVTIAGRQVQVTLRDTDEGRLLSRLEALLSRYPVAEPAAPASSASQAAQPTPEGWCIKHATQMKLNTNERGRWWSHALGDGKFCKGK